MMRISWQILVFVEAIMILMMLAASDEGIPPGAAAKGDLLLGESGEDGLSIEIPPAGAALNLVVGTTATAEDSIKIIGDGSWKLSVEDSNAGTSGHAGKMRKGSWSGDPSEWIYDTSNMALGNDFAVLVNGIGGNGQSGVKFNTLTDATELSNPVDIVTGDSIGSITLNLRYSQETIEGDAAGPYRIDLTYTLSMNQI